MEWHTTFGITSTAEWFVEVSSTVELAEACAWARERGVPIIIIAGGSNVVCAERVAGLVIKVVIQGIEIDGTQMRVGAGESLLEIVHAANVSGLAGIEVLAGIPGTIGGAVVGNAGAYGTELGSHVIEVEVFDGEQVLLISHSACSFAYRNSIFKKRRELVVLSVMLSLMAGDPVALAQKSTDIIKKREEKYPHGLLCPGSFFKNMCEDDVSQDIRARLPEHALVHGKIAVGYLIEAIDGRGMRLGGACVADYHGNLLINTGTATYADVRQLAEVLRDRVYKKFGVRLEEEIRYIE